MTESSQGAQGAGEEAREPFVSQGDRPEVRLDPDTPLSELRLRDLRDILWGGTGGKSPFVEKLPSLETANVSWKSEQADIQGKYAFDNKYQIYDKNLHKELKGVLDNTFVTGPPQGPGPDPRLNQVIQTVMGVSTQVEQLANQVAEMQRRLEG